MSSLAKGFIFAFILQCFMPLFANNKEAKDSKSYLLGDISVLSSLAGDSVKGVSNTLHDLAGVDLYVVVKNFDNVSPTANSYEMQKEFFHARREYEADMISKLDSNKYAILFLFYNTHSITLKTNLDFLDTQSILEDFAYPYLPAMEVGSDKYRDGVNEGLSNAYLAVAHKIASYYNITLNAPEPMQKPDGVVRFIIYVMLFSMLGLFVLVYFGILKSRNKK